MTQQLPAPPFEGIRHSTIDTSICSLVNKADTSTTSYHILHLPSRLALQVLISAFKPHTPIFKTDTSSRFRDSIVDKSNSSTIFDHLSFLGPPRLVIEE